MSHATRLCVICGARIPFPAILNKRVTTCSAECRDAKKNGITREEQILRDIKNEDRLARTSDPKMVGHRFM